MFHWQLAPTFFLSKFIISCLAYDSVKVYFPPTTTSHFAPPSLSRFVGLEAFETYGDLVPGVITGKPYQFITSERIQKYDLLMIGIDYEDTFLSKVIIPTSYTSVSIATSSLTVTMQQYLSIGERFYNFSVGSEFYTEDVTPPYILDTSVIASLQSKAASEFFTTLKSAIAFVESKRNHDDEAARFGSFQFGSLKEMRHSADPDVYQMALRYLAALIESASRSFSLAILIPSSSDTAVPRAPQPPPQSPLPIPKVPDTAPIFSTSTCHSSVEACQNATFSCSSRGSCIAATRAGRTCFVCACHPAPLSEAGKNISWAGAMCEKIDISQSFSLLFGTVIFFILAVGSAIALLHSIGTESLPGTLNIPTGGILTKKNS